MNAIRAIDTENRTATCEAGVVLQVLHEAAEKGALRFPLSLGGKGSATVGGLISTNAGGTQVRHGSMRALVLGLEAVLPDGSVFDALTPLKKDNRGFDLKQLLIGSEGTLGIVTAATLKLEPAVAARAVLWAGVESLPVARTLLLHAESAPAARWKVSSTAAAQPRRGDRLPADGARTAGGTPSLACADRTGCRCRPSRRPARPGRTPADQRVRGGAGHDATIAASETQADQMWLIRESIAPAERAIGPAVQHDISVPVERMPEFVETAVPLIEAAWPGTRAVGFGHLGDGNIHFHVLAPPGRCRGMAGRRWQGDQPPGPRSRHPMEGVDFGRTRHRATQARRTGAAGRSGGVAHDARQAGARSAGADESRQADLKRFAVALQGVDAWLPALPRPDGPLKALFPPDPRPARAFSRKFSERPHGQRAASQPAVVLQ
jgi:FAD/FMN-containing dehydrogenase